MQGGLETKKSFQENIKDTFVNSKISQEFFNMRRVSVPKDAADARRRVLANLDRFKLHYLAMSAAILGLYTLYCPVLLILIGIVSAAAYVHRIKPTLFNFQIESKSVCVAGGVGILIFFIFFKDAVTGLLAIVAVCSILTLVHAALLEEASAEEEDV